jgi:hypothetical protein
MKHVPRLVLPAIFAAALACGDDETGPVRVIPVPPDEKSVVLQDMELAYNQRNISRYDARLDENFVFHPAARDVGGSIPASWDRMTEIAAHIHLFTKDPPPPPPIPRCKSILLDIRWENQTAWVEVTPSAAPDETWYTTTVFYDFAIDVEPDITFLSNPGSKAQFTVRNAGTPAEPSWRLVEMTDLGAGSAAQATAASVEPVTWGAVKAMYR